MPSWSRKSKEKRKEPEQLRRLYIAYHHRKPTDADPSNLSFSLILTEKNPSPDENTCTRFRVVRQELLGDDTELEWTFSKDTAMSTRALRLLGVLLLAHVHPDVTVEQIQEILEAVEIQHVELVFKPELWIVAGLKALQKANMLPSDKEPREILDAGTRYTFKTNWQESGARISVPNAVPTCDVNGAALPSEITKPPSN